MPADWIDAAVEVLLRRQGEIEIPAIGRSMYPAIRPGDVCRFARCDADLLVPGMVVLFRSMEGRYVAHRYVKSIPQEGKSVYWFRGDTNLAYDSPIPGRRIMGRLVAVKRRRNARSRPVHIMTGLWWGRLIHSHPWVTLGLRWLANRSASERATRHSSLHADQDWLGPR